MISPGRQTFPKPALRRKNLLLWLCGLDFRRAPSRLGGISLTKVLSFSLSAAAGCFFLGFFLVFLWQSLPAWRHSGLAYLAGHTWRYRSHQFGCLPMIYGSAAVAGVSLVLSTPCALMTALFTAEYLPPGMRPLFKSAIELLAGIPSVVYGLLGVLIIRPWIYRSFGAFEPLSGDTLLTAGVLLALMILPTLVSLCDESLSGVAHSQKRAARALGMTRAETILHVSLPQAAPGICSAVLLAFGRAVGETIATYLVVGRQDNQLPLNLLELRPLLHAGQTLTSKLGGSESVIAYGDPLHWAAINGLGAALLLFTVIPAIFGVSRGGRDRA